MAIIFMDGMHGYHNVRPPFYRYGLRPGADYIATGAGFQSDPYLRVGDGTNDDCDIYLPNSDTIFFQAWIRLEHNAASFAIFRCWDGESTQVRLDFDNTGGISAFRGNSTQLGSKFSHVFSATKWHHMEAKVRIHNTTGEIIVKVDSLEVMRTTGVDTQNTTAAQITKFAFDGIANERIEFSNFILWDDTGTRLNDFIGPRKIIQLFPNGGGGVTQMTRSSTTSTNWELVDDDPASTATYVFTNSTGVRDRYTFTNLPAGVQTIEALQINTITRKTDVNDLITELFIESTGSETATTLGLSASGDDHVWQAAVVELDPASSVWSTGAVNKLRAGLGTLPPQ